MESSNISGQSYGLQHIERCLLCNPWTCLVLIKMKCHNNVIPHYDVMTKTQWTVQWAETLDKTSTDPCKQRESLTVHCFYLLYIFLEHFSLYYSHLSLTFKLNCKYLVDNTSVTLLSRREPFMCFELSRYQWNRKVNLNVSHTSEFITITDTWYEW